MNKKASILVIVLSLFLFSCEDYTGEFRDIENESIKISLPDWLEETKDLAKDNPEAFYQFKSRYRNTYGLVIKSKKSNKSFDKYQSDAVGILRNFTEMSNLLVTDSVFSENKIQLQLMGDLDSEKVYYWHNTYETNKYYYQLVLWTRSYDRKQKYTEVIEKVISSFQIK